MKISLLDSKDDKWPIGVETTWDELAEQLSDFRRTACQPCAGHDCPQKNGQAWSPVEYAEGAKRRKENVIAVHAIVLDFDAVTSEVAAKIREELAGLEYVIHSSHSYAPPERLALRVIIPLTEPVAGRQWTDFWRAFVETLGLPADEACKDPSRLYFCPSAPEGATTFYERGRGVAFDPALLGSWESRNAVQAVAPVEVNLPPTTGPVNLEALRDELKKVDKDLSKALAKKVLAGEALATPGGRDEALNRAAALLAWALPLSTPVEALLELLRPSMMRMELQPEGYEHWRKEVDDMVIRARKRRVEKMAEERTMSLAMNMLAGRSVQEVKSEASVEVTPPTRPLPETKENVPDSLDVIEPELVYVLPWDRFVYRINGMWQVSAPVTPRAAKAHLKQRGILDRVLTRLDPESPIAEAVANLKELTDNPLCLSVDAIDCLPGEAQLCRFEGRVLLNTWTPPKLEAVQGEWPGLRRAFEYLTADEDGKPDPGGAEWLINWMAAKVQNPGATLLTSPVIHGPPGSGKNTVLRAFMESLGKENCATINQQTLESTFNAHYVHKLFVFADDCIPRGSLRDLSGQLKVAITGDTVIVNAKGVQQTEVKNRAVWAFASNSDNPVQVELGDRRYSVFSNRANVTDEWRDFLRSFWRPERPNEPSAWFWREMQAFRYEMETRAVDYALARTPHRNAARENVIEANLGSAEMFIREVEELGFGNVAETVGASNLLPPSRQRDKNAVGAFTAHYVYLAYKKWCEDRGYRNPVTSNRFGRCVSRSGHEQWCRKQVPAAVYWPPERERTVAPLSALEKIVGGGLPKSA